MCNQNKSLLKETDFAGKVGFLKHELIYITHLHYRFKSCVTKEIWYSLTVPIPIFGHSTHQQKHYYVLHQS